MTPFFQDSIDTLMNSRSTEEVRFQLLKIAHLLGFENFAFGTRAPSLDSSPKVLMVNSYSDTWNDLYQKNDFILIDPIVRKATFSTEPVLWENELTESNDFCDAARDCGLSIGWSNAIHKPNGASSLFSVCRSTESLTDAELNKLSPYLYWVSNLAVQTLERVNNDYAGVVLTEILTPREIEILKWSSEGKTANEIAIILGITVRTVTFHITNCVAKLNACNKTSAIIKAVSLGLLDI